MLTDLSKLRRVQRGPIWKALLAFSMVALIASSGPVSAADFYWDTDTSTAGNDEDTGEGLGGTGTWDTTTSNWWNTTSLVVWPNGGEDHAIFTYAYPALGIPVLNAVTLGGGINANRLSFLRSGYTLSGGTLTLSGTAPTLHANLGEFATIETQILGSDGLTKTGGGSIRLTDSTSSYTGTTSITNGILVLGDPAALGEDTSAVVVTGSSTRGFGGGSLVLEGGYGSGMDFTRDLEIQGYGPITDRNAALRSVGTNTVSGNILFGGGSVATAIQSAGGLLTLSGDISPAGTGQLRFGLVNSAGVGGYHVTGTITSGNNIEKLGLGTLILDMSDGGAGFSGNVIVNNGSVRVSHGSFLGSSTANGAITMGGGTGTLEIRTDDPESFGDRRVLMITSGTGTIVLDHAAGSGLINETVVMGPLTLTAGGSTRTLVINGRNGYGITFLGDSVGGAIGGNNNITVNANGVVTFDGDFWNNTHATARTLTMTVGTGAQAVISGSLVGSGGDHILTKAGAGTLTILGNESTYAGVTNLNAGTLSISSFGSFNNNGATINIGTTTTSAILRIIGHDLDPADTTTSKVINLAGTTGGATILANQTGTSSALVFNANFDGTGGTAANAKTLTLGGENTLDNTINGIIPNNNAGGTVNLVKTGVGTWVLGGENTYTGTTTISNGTLKLRADAETSTVVHDSSAIVFDVTGTSAGGALEFVGQDGENNVEQLGNLSAAAGANTIRLTPGAGGTASLVFSSLGTVSGTASLNILGSDSSNAATLTGVTDGLVGPNIFFDSSHFAYAESGVLRAAVYGTDAGFLTTAGGTDELISNSHWEMTGNVTQTGNTNFRSLRIVDSDLTGTNLRVNEEGNPDSTGATTHGTIISLGDSVINGSALHTAGSGTLVLNVVDGTLTLNVILHQNTTGGMTKTGAGTLIIAGVNAYLGGTTLNEGTIQLATGGRLSANSQAFVIRAGAVLDLNGVSTATSATASSIGSFNGDGTITNTSADAVLFAVGGGTSGGTGTFAGMIDEVDGQISVVKMGTTNSQTWTGLSNYTGSTTIGVAGTGTTGVLSVFYLANIGEDSSIGRGDGTDDATNAASLIFGGTTGGLTYVGNTSVSTDRLFTLAGTAATAGATISNDGINNATLVFSNTGPIAFGSTANQLLRLSGTSLGDNLFNLQIIDNVDASAVTSLSKVSTGMWILGNGDNSYTGTTTIGRGLLALSDNGALPDNSPILLGQDTGGTNRFGILQMNGVFERELAATPVAGTGTITWGTTTGTVGGGGFAAHTEKLIVSIGGLNTPTALVWGEGGFVGTNGTQSLHLGSVNSLAEVEFRNDIDINGADRTITVVTNTSTFTDYATISGDITNSTGTAGITKAGNGVLYLRGDNTYNGNTAVTAGTVVVEGSDRRDG